MLHWIKRSVAIFALCLSLGFHWVALQSVAWTTMLVSNACHAPLGDAVAKTFDGAHPCSLCHVVRAGEKSDKKSGLQAPSPKIDLICLAHPVPFQRPFIPFVYPTIVFHCSDIGDSPPVPPPRPS